MLFRKAILMIHGFSGSLSDNEILVNQLQGNRSFDVYAWTLPAHEKAIINKVKYQDWVHSADQQMQFLIDHGYRTIYVIGHSMGGVLAGYLASKYKQVKKIVFIAGAFDYLSTAQNKTDLLHFWTLRGDSDAGYKNFFIKLFKVPMSTMMEFRKLIKRYRPCIHRVTIPCLILQGDIDEVVPKNTAYYIFDTIGSKKKTVTIIKKARHIVLIGRRKQEVTDYIEQFLKGGFKWKRMKKSEL